MRRIMAIHAANGGMDVLASLKDDLFFVQTATRKHFIAEPTPCNAIFHCFFKDPIELIDVSNFCSAQEAKFSMD